MIHKNVAITITGKLFNDFKTSEIIFRCIIYRLKRHVNNVNVTFTVVPPTKAPSLLGAFYL